MASSTSGNYNESMIVPLSDETSTVTTGVSKMTFRTPYAMNLYQLPRLSTNTTANSAVSVDIRQAGSTIFGANKLTIDANSRTSTTSLAAPMIITNFVPDDTELTFDVLSAGGTLLTMPQAAFTLPGTYTWRAPLGITAVSVVCVGGGGGGYSTWSSAAGSGGGLGYKNNIAVVPGALYTVVVGAGGTGGATVTAGGNSYFNSLATVAGYGGGNATAALSTGGANANGTYGGGWVGDGGGAGGLASNYQGGGGAGGYSGNGGANNGGAAVAGSGGGGGGAYYSSTYGTGAGGGVGIYGKGADGAAQANAGWGGNGGSGGANGAHGEAVAYPTGPGAANKIPGGAFGGGGGGPGTSWGGGAGGSGAVRIIWGTNRTFPSTNTTDVATWDQGDGVKGLKATLYYRRT